MNAAPTLTMLLGIGALAALIGVLLTRLASGRRHDTPPAAASIDALLPQTQCGRCQFAGCRPYAEAIATGEADINRCPPGGDATIRALAALLQREPRPLDPQVGPSQPRQVAWIDDDRCIGCARCIPACPVDAIVGTQKLAHTVIADHCTGCELCLPPCPVDCIELRPLDVLAHDTQRHCAA